MTKNEQDENAHDQITKQVSASRHTPEPMTIHFTGEELHALGYSLRCARTFHGPNNLEKLIPAFREEDAHRDDLLRRINSCLSKLDGKDALAGMNPEAVKDVVSALESALKLMDAAFNPANGHDEDLITFHRATLQHEANSLRGCLAALKGAK